MSYTEQVEKMMKSLGITKEEAMELIEADEEVDRMKDKEVDNDLTEEQKQAVKKAKNTTSATKPKKSAPKRKEDAEKRYLIEILADHLADLNIDGDVVNVEREIAFTYNSNSYSLTLTKHRKK